jgi:hypothetical protein
MDRLPTIPSQCESRKNSQQSNLFNIGTLEPWTEPLTQPQVKLSLTLSCLQRTEKLISIFELEGQGQNPSLTPGQAQLVRSDASEERINLEQENKNKAKVVI